MGSGFWTPETPSKAAGPRELGQSSPGSPYGERGAGGENGLGCFLDPRRVGAVVCCPRRLSFAECSCQKFVLGVPCDGASALSGQAGSGGMAGARAQKAFVRPILLPHEGEPVGSGLRTPETPSKAAGPRELGQPSPGSPYGERGAGGENSLRCFLDPRRVGAVVCCPRRASSSPAIRFRRHRSSGRCPSSRSVKLRSLGHN